jgi:5'-nucleotidase
MNAQRVLITNDDGIDSDGLRRLALTAVDAGCAVVVAAPSTDSSGASSSLTAVQADGRIVMERHRLDGLDNVPAFGVVATPAYITLLAIRGAFGDPPDVVLSGINRGHNAGQAVLHSGTVGAVLTAAAQGCRGMAVSVAAAHVPRWDSAAAAAGELLPWLVSAPPRTVLNVNAPDFPAEQVRGRRLATLASFGAVQTNIAEVGEQFVRVQVADVNAEMEPGTDAALLAEGWVTVTSLRPVCEDNPAMLGLHDRNRVQRDARPVREGVHDAVPGPQ